MHRTRISLIYHTESGDRLQEVGRVIDVLTRNRAEYLVLSRESQPPLQVRLDRIHSLTPQDGLS